MKQSVWRSARSKRPTEKRSCSWGSDSKDLVTCRQKRFRKGFLLNGIDFRPLTNPFRPVSAIPIVVRWMQWLVPIAFAYANSNVVEFRDMERSLDSKYYTQAQRETFIKERDIFFKDNGYSLSNYWPYIAMQLGHAVLYRTLAVGALWLNSQSLYK